MSRRNRPQVLYFILIFLGLLTQASTHAQQSALRYSPNGVDINCQDILLSGGIAFILNRVRPGFDYTVTVVGGANFDPRLAVLPGDGSRLCSDDNGNAATYAAALPTFRAAADASSAQITFQVAAGVEYREVIAVVSGSPENLYGEFVVLIEGLALTESDEGLDPIEISFTPGMRASGVPLTVYMMGDQIIDPMIYTLEGSGDLALDNDGLPISCLDAGSRCWTRVSGMDDARLSLGQGTVWTGTTRDAALSIDTTYVNPTRDPSLNYISYRLSDQELMDQARGPYLLAIHASIAPITANGIALSQGNAAGECPTAAVVQDEVFTVDTLLHSGEYRATALGIGSFDPTLEVSDTLNHCFYNNTSTEAAAYTLFLPPIGMLNAPETSAQVKFGHRDTDPQMITFTVRSADSQPGVFLLLLENLTITGQENNFLEQGDLFRIPLTAALRSSGVPFRFYMIAYTTQLDPFLQRVNQQRQVVSENGQRVQCNDTATSTCWGQSYNLDRLVIDSHLTYDFVRYGGPVDAMIELDLDTLAGEDALYLQLSSFQDQSAGKYLVVIYGGLSPGTP